MHELKEIVFCIMMLANCLYLWYVQTRIDDILNDIRELLEGDGNKCPGQQ